MNLRTSLLVSVCALALPLSAALANPLDSGLSAMNSGYSPQVPVSAFARPASWLDPSRLGVTASFSVMSGFGGGTSALQTTTLSYRFKAPLSMSVSLGNAMGGSSFRSNGSQFFLQGFEADYRPLPSLQFHVQYQNVQSPLQYQSSGLSPWAP